MVEPFWSSTLVGVLLWNRMIRVSERKPPDGSGERVRKQIKRKLVHVTNNVIVRPPCETFSGLIIEAFDTGTVVGHVVYATGRQVYPSVRDATQNNVIWDLYVDDKRQRHIPCSVKGLARFSMKRQAYLRY